MIANFDFLSTPITLFHLERRTHTSRVGATLVIALIFICFSYTIFLFYNLITHKQMTYIFHKKFEYEAGYYSFNSSSVFHFIQIFAPDNGGYFDKFDSRYIRAYTTYAQSDLTYSNLHLHDHWVFDQCRKNVDDEGLDPSLFINVENFTNGVCIRHFYNSSGKKYYSFGTDGFKWPYLEHGIAQRNNIYLTTIVQKCSNDSIINEIFGNCPPQKEIDDYVSKYLAIYLYFTDTQVDPTYFKKPITQFLQVVSTGVGTSQTYVESYIHFSPVRILTKIGSIFGESYELNSFYFDFNRKGSANNVGQKYFTITRYYHLMQNNVQIYERRYNNIFDIFSEIGGIAQFTFYLFYWINYVYNLYIVDADINSMFFSIEEHKEKSKSKRHTHFNLDSISNKTKINGNDNQIYIQNNFVRLSKNDVKKFRNSKFYVNPNDKDENKNNHQKHEIILKKHYSKQLNSKDINFEIHSFNRKKMKKDKTINSCKLNDDNSQEILYNSKNKKNLDFTGSLRSYNKNNITHYNNSSINSKFMCNKAFVKQEKNKFDIYNKDFIEKDEDKNKVKFHSERDIITNICISKESINNIDYDNQIPFKRLRHVSFLLDFTKSLIFKKEKTNYYYIHLFRKHLLSEEHLLKSHIILVLLEKKYNINNEEKTNFFECYDKL